MHYNAVLELFKKLFLIYATQVINLCYPIHGIINYFTFICPFESESMERKKKKFEHLEKYEIKSILHDF